MTAMGRNWTPEQSSAIKARGGTLLVSAAAGSGKTAVLVERVIGLITDKEHPCDADRLLVVTFTTAAAAEMRERISQRLADMIEKNPLDANLQRQQMLLQNAHISTIHSFCLDLLREHFEKLDIPPDFRIADQNEADILRDDVLHELLESKYAGEFSGKTQSGAFLELSRILSSGRDDSLLSDTILRLYEFTRSLADADAWLDKTAAMYEAKPVKDTIWGKIAAEYTLEAAQAAIESHKRSLEKINSNAQLQKAYSGAFESDCAQLKKIARLAQNGTWDELRAAVCEFSFERLGALKKFDDEELKTELQDARKAVKKMIADLKGSLLCCGEKEFCEDLEKLRPVVSCLCETVKELDRNFFKEKLSRGVLDFSDLEQLTLKLLVKNGEKTQTAREVSQRFDEVLVDEYQDTNPAQDMIFHAVSRDDKNLFMVGDVKQSIYSFRQARPEIFTQSAEKCVPYGSGFPAKIILGRNFRSRRGVTQAVNFVFERLMSQKLGGVDYGESEKLIAGADYFERDGADFALHIVDAEDFDGDEEGSELEARHIAREIKSLVESGFMVKGENGPRKVTYRDFCIMLRSMSGHAEKYSRVLQEEGVPVFAEIEGGYLGAYEVMVAVSLLRILDNPLQDVPLLSVLLSPVFGFTPDDVSEIRIKSRDKSLYLALLELSKSGDTRFDGFLKLLDKLRALAAVLPADRLILRIYDETGLLNVFEAMPNGGLRRANLRLLLDYARAYESAGWRGLAGFIRFIDRIDSRRGDLAPAGNISENADVVRIMSIHKSKGLEFPVCFLAGLSKRFNMEDAVKPALFHPSCGFGIILRDKELNCRYTTLPREAVKLQTVRSTLSEEMRVLYVALTRAKERLYAVMTLKKPQSTLKRAAAINRGSIRGEYGAKISPYQAMTAQSPAELLLATALSHPSCGKLRELAGAPDIAVGQSADEWETELIKANELLPEEQKPVEQNMAQRPEAAELTAKIEQRLDYAYPYKKLSELPSKISVSELSHKVSAPFSAEKIRPSFLDGENLTPAEKGTALHAFMQYCDFDKISDTDAIKAEIKRLTDKKFLLPEQAAAVDVGRVAAFASSQLFARIKASKGVWREFRFNIELPAREIYEDAADVDEKILLQGMADLVFEENGGVTLLDYKTDRVSDGIELIEKYRVQLDCYARAAKEILGLEVKERFIYSFHLNTALKVS
jgi:ATP-dependent helicase/nuclease subunit A